MPRFHFNVYDGHSEIDWEGTEFPDWRAARIAAIELAGEIIRDNAKQISSGEIWRIEVTDDGDFVLLRLDLSVVESPVVESLGPA